MYSYIEKLEIIASPTLEGLKKNIESFSIGKCVKNIIYKTSISNLYVAEKYQAYVYYTYPEPPTITLTGLKTGTSAFITLDLSSVIWLKLTQVGVYYNTTNIFSVRNDRVLFPNTYGTTTIEVTGLIDGATYYFKPYIDVCLGRLYGDTLTLIGADYLQDTYGEFITDTYGEYIIPL